MTADQFRNAILLLNCIDADEFTEGLLSGDEYWVDNGGPAMWNSYCSDPIKFYIHASDKERNALWAIIEKRLTKGESNDSSD